MPREGHPVTSHLFVGKPKNIEAQEETDPVIAALRLKEGDTVYVPDADTAKRTLAVLGADDDHAHNAVHYAD